MGFFSCGLFRNDYFCRMKWSRERGLPFFVGSVSHLSSYIYYEIKE